MAGSKISGGGNHSGQPLPQGVSGNSTGPRLGSFSRVQERLKALISSARTGPSNSAQPRGSNRLRLAIFGGKKKEEEGEVVVPQGNRGLDDIAAFNRLANRAHQEKKQLIGKQMPDGFHLKLLEGSCPEGWSRSAAKKFTDGLAMRPDPVRFIID